MWDRFISHGLRAEPDHCRRRPRRPLSFPSPVSVRACPNAVVCFVVVRALGEYGDEGEVLYVANVTEGRSAITPPRHGCPPPDAIDPRLADGLSSEGSRSQGAHTTGGSRPRAVHVNRKIFYGRIHAGERAVGVTAQLQLSETHGAGVVREETTDERFAPDRKSTRLNSSHSRASRMPSSA